MTMDEKEKTPDFDFDLWSRMAQQEPEKFEAMRQQLISDLIEQAPSHLKQRIVGLQWQVDQVRKQASTPMAACLQISQKMWANVLKERKVLLQALQEPKTILDTLNNEQPCKILSFEKHKPSQ